jgi:hypothetical protein
MKRLSLPEVMLSSTTPFPLALTTRAANRKECFPLLTNIEPTARSVAAFMAIYSQINQGVVPTPLSRDRGYSEIDFPDILLLLLSFLPFFPNLLLSQ